MLRILCGVCLLFGGWFSCGEEELQRNERRLIRNEQASDCQSRYNSIEIIVKGYYSYLMEIPSSVYFEYEKIYVPPNELYTTVLSKKQPSESISLRFICPTTLENLQPILEIFQEQNFESLEYIYQDKNGHCATYIETDFDISNRVEAKYCTSSTISIMSPKDIALLDGITENTAHVVLLDKYMPLATYIEVKQKIKRISKEKGVLIIPIVFSDSNDYFLFSNQW